MNLDIYIILYYLSIIIINHKKIKQIWPTSVYDTLLQLHVVYSVHNSFNLKKKYIYINIILFVVNLYSIRDVSIK